MPKNSIFNIIAPLIPGASGKRPASASRQPPPITIGSIIRTAAMATPYGRLLPIAEVAIKNPQLVAQAARQGLGSVRAGVSGYLDQASGRRIDEVSARARALVGQGGDGDFEQRLAETRQREQARDAEDRQNHPDARLAGRDAAATVEFAALAGQALTGGGSTPAARGQMHALLTNRPVSHPQGMEAYVPILGAGKEAVADYQDGDYLGAALNAALAASDIFPVKAAGTALAKVAAKKAFYKAKPGLSDPYAWEKVRSWLGDIGEAKPGQLVHHWFQRQPRENAPTWQKMVFNQPWNLLPMRPQGGWVIHDGIHGQFHQPFFDGLRHLHYGTPDWLKAYATYGLGHTASAEKREADHHRQLMTPDTQGRSLD